MRQSRPMGLIRRGGERRGEKARRRAEREGGEETAGESGWGPRSRVSAPKEHATLDPWPLSPRRAGDGRIRSVPVLTWSFSGSERVVSLPARYLSSNEDAVDLSRLSGGLTRQVLSGPRCLFRADQRLMPNGCIVRSFLSLTRMRLAGV